METVAIWRPGTQADTKQAGTGGPPGRGDGAGRADSLARPPAHAGTCGSQLPRLRPQPTHPHSCRHADVQQGHPAHTGTCGSPAPDAAPTDAHPPLLPASSPPCRDAASLLCPRPREDHGAQGTRVRPEVEDKGARVTPGHILGAGHTGQGFWSQTDWPAVCQGTRDSISPSAQGPAVASLTGSLS